MSPEISISRWGNSQGLRIPIADIPSDYKKEKEQFLEPMGKEIY